MQTSGTEAKVWHWQLRQQRVWEDWGQGGATRGLSVPITSLSVVKSGPRFGKDVLVNIFASQAICLLYTVFPEVGP